MRLHFLKIATLAFASLALVTTSCSNEEIETTDALTQSNLPKDVLKKIYDLKLKPQRFKVEKITSLNGTTQEFVIVDDIMMKKEQFLTIPSDKDGVSRQYQTEFIVDIETFDVINIFVFTGDLQGFGLTEAAQQGVLDAIDNWNSVPLSAIKLEVDFQDSYDNFNPDFHEIEILARPDIVEGFGGFAEFPSPEGKPGRFVVIGGKANTLSKEFPDAIEHLITHEIGHTIGFRHTDWNSRQSCVDLNIEDEPSIEEGNPTRIFGTLPSIPGIIDQEDSIMNSCFSIESNGELNLFDKVGVRSMYPKYY